LGEEETAHKRTLETLVKRASKPNKKITTASWLLPVHSLLSNVFGPAPMWIHSEKLSQHVPECTVDQRGPAPNELCQGYSKNGTVIRTKHDKNNSKYKNFSWYIYTKRCPGV
jgi:hypothetical protein